MENNRIDIEYLYLTLIKFNFFLQYHAFSFISTILNSERFTAEEKASVQAEALRNLQVSSAIFNTLIKFKVYGYMF